MMKPKAGPVVGGILGLLALVGLTVTLMSPSALERRVDEFLARERDETPEARHQDVPKRLEELQGMQKDPHFPDIPGQKQDLVNQRVRELDSYSEFVASMANALDPKDIQNEEQLVIVEKSLELRKAVTNKYQSEWEQTDAGRRYAMFLNDAASIEKAAEDVRKGYRAATAEGDAVLRDRNAPRLPQRAKTVLDRAAQLPAPEKDKDKRLPGSERLTYAVVFRFPSVVETYRAWEKVRDRLKPLAVE